MTNTTVTDAKSRSSKRASLRGPLAICMIYEDLNAAAQTIYDALQTSDLMVWTDEQARVLADHPDRTRGITSNRVAGIYSPGAGPRDIEEDLVALRAQWMPADIIF